MRSIIRSDQLLWGFMLLMIFSIFLPWADYVMAGQGEVRYMGPGSPAMDVIGINYLSGLVVLVCSLLCGFLLFWKIKLAIIPGLANCIISLMHIFQASGIIPLETPFLPFHDPFDAYTQGYFTGPDYGIYILCISSVLFVIQIITQPTKEMDQTLGKPLGLRNLY